ncbi:hypothetical protein [Streptomyces sp. NPDC056683]|uniref:hypothetical protein n=1 Tax=Streptomyces sp. NPDC056683 TaxID=3345910 RepID=UPI0036A2B4AF
MLVLAGGADGVDPPRVLGEHLLPPPPGTPGTSCALCEPYGEGTVAITWSVFAD